MQTITVYQTDDNDIFLYPVEANPLPFAPEQHNVPFRAVTAPPPAVPVGQRARWQSEFPAASAGFNIGQWLIEDVPPEPEQPEDGATINPQ